MKLSADELILHVRNTPELEANSVVRRLAELVAQLTTQGGLITLQFKRVFRLSDFYFLSC